MKLAVRLSALMALSLAAPTLAVPRVVSLNPCLDAILLEVADPAQLLAISHYSRNPAATSVPLDKAARVPVTAGTAEEVVALAPDLVLAGSHVDPATLKALRRLNIRLLQLGVPDSLAESQAQVSAIARAIGQPARGAALNARIRLAIAAARPAPGTPPVPALIWQGGGLVPGQGTLPDALLASAGFRNLSPGYGLKPWDVLPLEALVARPPRLLLTTTGQGDRLLGHPVLHGLKRHTRLHPFPEKLMRCGGPTIIAALAELAAARQAP